MITSLYVSCADDNFIEQLELDTLVYPLQKFSWPYETDGAEIGKMQSPGRHSWHKFVRNLPIDLEGEILADSTSQFWTRRKALLEKIIPEPTGTVYDPVKFRMTVDGDSNVYYAFCVLESMVGALTASGSPTVSEFMLGFSCRFGYWRRESDDVAVRI